jgi:1-acylglycerone phosphate reductase
MIRQGSGLIVNVGSVTAYLSTPWGGLYSASKAAVHSISDALRMELAPFGVKVSVVSPGAIKSNIGDNNLKAFHLPEDSFYQSVIKYVMARANASQGRQKHRPVYIERFDFDSMFLYEEKRENTQHF